jgi:predicted TIM-barrel fold metal-dependent hydrolase
MSELPLIISVDDHVIDPPNLWLDRLPAKYHDRAPRVKRQRVERIEGRFTNSKVIESPTAKWADVWYYDDLATPVIAGVTAVGTTRDLIAHTMVTYDEIDPGCWQQGPRLASMVENGNDVQLIFPQFPRFCGQTFFEREDKELALLCVKAYNDFLIDEWCAGDAYGKQIPVTIVPLWDADLAADEIRRCAAKGSHAVTFSEVPPLLGLPSLYSGYWDPFFAACDETDTVINMHVGSSSTMLTTSPDAPVMMVAALNHTYLSAAYCDWMFSGKLAQFPNLRIALSEGQVGWWPYMMERVDSLWERSALYERDLRSKLPERPSSYIPGRVYGCVYDDVAGLRARDQIGMSQIMFEIDYPHADSTWPNSRQVAEKIVAEAGLDEDETYRLLRGNAIECYRLDRYGVTA